MTDIRAYEFGRVLFEKQLAEGFGPNELLTAIAGANKGKFKGKANEIWHGYCDRSAKHEEDVREKWRSGK